MTALLNLAGFLTAGDRTRWEDAACRGDAHPDRWFPDPSESYDYAAAVCARCPIVTGCAAYAAGTRQSGVWGGREYRGGAVVR